MVRLITTSWRFAVTRRRSITIIIDINITKGLIIIEHTPRNIISVLVTYKWWILFLKISRCFRSYYFVMLTTPSPLWIAKNVDKFLQYLNNKQPSIRLPWRQKTTTNCLFQKPQFQENRTAASPHRRIQETYARRSVLNVWFPLPAINKTWYCRVPLRARQTYHNKTLCYLQGEKASLLLSSLMVTLVLSCRKSPRSENWGPVLSPWSSTSILRFYPMSKVYPNNFAAAFNNKAYSLFSSRRLH